MQVPPLWCKYAVGESMLLGSIVCAVGSHTAGGFGPSCKWGTFELICTSGGIPRSKKKNSIESAILDRSRNAVRILFGLASGIPAFLEHLLKSIVNSC